MLRLYARVAGIGLFLVGLAGLVGMHGLGAGEDLLFTATGILFLYGGFSRPPGGTRGGGELRWLVGAMGALYLLSAVVVTVVSDVLLGGEAPPPASNPPGAGDLVRAAVGAACLFAALLLPCGDDGGPPPTTTRRRP